MGATTRCGALPTRPCAVSDGGYHGLEPLPRQRLVAATLGVIYFTAIAILNRSIALYFLIWLIGVAASRQRLPTVWIWVYVPALATVAVLFRALRFDNNIAADATLAAIFAASLCTLRRGSKVGAGSRFARLASTFLVIVLVYTLRCSYPDYRDFTVCS
jgi:hypothetical protein